MRFLIAALMAVPLLAQEAAKPAEEAKSAEQAKPAETSKPEEKPAGEPGFSGTVDFGYRFTGIAGNENVYRSVVDYDEGPRLFGADFTINSASRRLFDRIDARTFGWGGDPHTGAYVSARKLNAYDFRADYRSIAYYSFLPSFANPFRDLGIAATERAFDTRRRFSDISLDLFPGKRIVPYVAFGRNSWFGRGITTFVAGGNEYPVLNEPRSELSDFRAGVRFEMNRWHLTLEQGGTTFRDDQTVSTSDRNLGNRTTPFLRQTLALNNVREAYGVRGDSIYTRIMAGASPFPWMNLFGQFLFSQPKTETRFDLSAAGNFVLMSPLLFYNTQSDLFTGSAKMPHSSGNAGAEIRVHRRLRVTESWLTDRLHNASTALLAETLLLSGGAARPLTPLFQPGRLVMNYNHQEVNLLFDLTSRITLRGGHRYVWGNAGAPPSGLTPGGEIGEMKRHVALAGGGFRTRLFSVHADFEGASSGRAYFRTSLADYRRGRVRGTFQPWTSLGFSANLSVLSNHNPAAGSRYDYLWRENTVTATWTPNAAKRFSVLAEYSRYTMRSDIDYLEPETLTPARSLYRENAHTATTLVDFSLPQYGGQTGKLTVGGSLFSSGGSRPTRFYQPQARVALPLMPHVAWTMEWRYYGFGEQFYRFEGFRSHLFMIGLRFSR
ncbi:MAG: hypothetical protein ACE15B_20915 [Bryobacteraceae bacterium]